MSRPSLNLITLYICTRTKLFVLTGCWFWVGQADRSWKCFCTHTSRWYIWLHASGVRPRSFWLILIQQKWLDLMQHLRCRYAQYGEVSPKIDVYAFGVVLYELISAMEAVVKTNETITESTGLVALVVILALQWSPLHVSAKLFQLELSCACWFLAVWRSSSSAWSERRSSETCWPKAWWRLPNRLSQKGNV